MRRFTPAVREAAIDNYQLSKPREADPSDPVWQAVSVKAIGVMFRAVPAAPLLV